MVETTETTAEAGTGPLGAIGAAAQVARERIFFFGVVYVGIFAMLALYVVTVRIVEDAFQRHYQSVVERAVVVQGLGRPVADQVAANIERDVLASPWVDWGGIVVRPLVLARDGVTWLYVDGRTPPSAGLLGPGDVLSEAVTLLPASTEVVVSIPHNALLANGILVAYAAVLLQLLYLYNRSQARKAALRLEEAHTLRDAAARRSESIEGELVRTRERLAKIEPKEHANAMEVAELQRERESLQRQLTALATREEELIGMAHQTSGLAQEVRALEDLLEEASEDLEAKNSEIRELEKQLKSADKNRKAAERGKTRAAEQLGKRLRTLYKNLEIDERAVDDIVALRDENNKLRAEEALKRLSDEADNVAVRRKVGGIPDRLNIYELGFAGKGRIYYMRGRQRRFRVLAVGAKNSQQADLEYLSRLGSDQLS